MMFSLKAAGFQRDRHLPASLLAAVAAAARGDLRTECHLLREMPAEHQEGLAQERHPFRSNFRSGTSVLLPNRCQTVAFSAAVVVTTPQKLAYVDVVKGIRMFARLQVCPVSLSVVVFMPSDRCGTDFMTVSCPRVAHVWCIVCNGAMQPDLSHHTRGL